MRSRLLVSLGLLCIATAAWVLGWRYGGGSGLALAAVVSSPLVALAFAPLVVPLLAASVRAVQEVAYRDIQGKYFAFKGHRVRIQEDESGSRWVRVRDIRDFVPEFPRDQVLLRIAPDAIGRPEGERELYFQAASLDRYLARSRAEATIRFRNWLQREVLLAAERAARFEGAGTDAGQSRPTGAS